MNKLTGTITHILPAESVGQNGTSKRTFVLETEGQYPKKVAITAWKEKADLLDSFSEGDKAEVSFDVESREYNGKWYTDVKAVFINKQGGASSSKPAAKEKPAVEEDNDDSLPF
jgi:hypothetical protein